MVSICSDLMFHPEWVSVCFQQVVFRRTIADEYNLLYGRYKRTCDEKKVTQTQTNSFLFPSGLLNQQGSKVKVQPVEKRTEFIKHLLESNGSRRTVCWSNHGRAFMNKPFQLQLRDGFSRPCEVKLIHLIQLIQRRLIIVESDVLVQGWNKLCCCGVPEDKSWKPLEQTQGVWSSIGLRCTVKQRFCV